MQCILFSSISAPRPALWLMLEANFEQPRSILLMRHDVECRGCNFLPQFLNFGCLHEDTMLCKADSHTESLLASAEGRRLGTVAYLLLL